MRKNKKTVVIVLGVLVIALFARVLVSALKLSPVFFQLLFNHGISLKETEGRVNLLLLGIGGGTHEGPDLTDTVIFASVDPTSKKISLVSIPRDLWVPELHGKINTAYAIGEEKKKGGGLILAEAAVSKIIGQSINYGIRIDFNGFVKAIDLVGGITVTVDNPLDDYAYPIEGKENDTCGHSDTEIASLSAQLASSSATLTELDAFPCRYEHIHFDKGTQHLDGTQALQYVRSRHALGDEGTDFARSRRQEKVLTALRDKVFSAETLLNPVKLNSLSSILQESIDSDIKQDEYDDFIRLAQKVKGGKIQSTVLDYGDTETGRPGLLANPPISDDYDLQWVLIPRIGNGNFSEIQKYVNCEIKTGNCEVSKTPPR